MGRIAGDVGETVDRDGWEAGFGMRVEWVVIVRLDVWL